MRGKRSGMIVEKIWRSLGDKAQNLSHLRISPDGEKVATEFGDITTSIWVYDLKRKVNTRFTLESAKSTHT